MWIRDVEYVHVYVCMSRVRMCICVCMSRVRMCICVRMLGCIYAYTYAHLGLSSENVSITGAAGELRAPPGADPSRNRDLEGLGEPIQKRIHA